MTKRTRETAERARAQMASAPRAEENRAVAKREGTAAKRTPSYSAQILNLDNVPGSSSENLGKTVIEAYEPVFFIDRKFDEHQDCFICKHSLNKLCNKCRFSESNREDGSCKNCVGECGHKLHKHCWNDWRQTSNDTRCPLDLIAFVIEREY